MAKTSTHGQTLRLILAQNVRTYRAKTKISQEELAARCGLHRTYIGSIERAERNATLSTLEVIAVALGVSVVNLLTEPSNDNV
jgi:transcriptional regulator with XRE-family HTH domain